MYLGIFDSETVPHFLRLTSLRLPLVEAALRDYLGFEQKWRPRFLLLFLLLLSDRLPRDRRQPIRCIFSYMWRVEAEQVGRDGSCILALSGQMIGLTMAARPSSDVSLPSNSHLLHAQFSMLAGLILRFERFRLKNHGLLTLNG